MYLPLNVVPGRETVYMCICRFQRRNGRFHFGLRSCVRDRRAVELRLEPELVQVPGEIHVLRGLHQVPEPRRRAVRASSTL